MCQGKSHRLHRLHRPAITSSGCPVIPLTSWLWVSAGQPKNSRCTCHHKLFYRRATLTSCLGRRIHRTVLRLNTFRIILDGGNVNVNHSQPKSRNLIAPLSRSGLEFHCIYFVTGAVPCGDFLPVEVVTLTTDCISEIPLTSLLISRREA